MFQQKIHTAVGLFLVMFSSADAASPIDDSLTKMLNAAVPATNQIIKNTVPDILELDIGEKGDKSGGCCKKWGTCWCCKWSYYYQVHFGTVKGMKTLQIDKFYKVAFDASMTSGSMSVGLLPAKTPLEDGTAKAGVKYCGVPADAKGSAKATCSFSSSGALTVQGKVQGDCLKLKVTGSKLYINNLKIYDTKVNINLAGLNMPGFSMDWFIDLIEALVPDITNLIADWAADFIEPEIVKLVNDICVPLPGSAFSTAADDDAVLQVDDEASTEFHRPRRPRRTRN